MTKTEERADNFSAKWLRQDQVQISYDGYMQGDADRLKIDIRKACEALCSMCPDKQKCFDSSWDSTEQTRLAISCKKIDKMFKALED